MSNTRPKFLKDFPGQEPIKKQLEILIKSTRMRGDILPHILLKGLSGCGKTTLAHIIANEMGASQIEVLSPASLKTETSFMNLFRKDPRFIFIDEIHGLLLPTQETLGLIMEDFKINAPVKRKNRIVDRRIVNVSPFTLIGATTLEGLISKPLRDRFKIHFQFLPYGLEESIDIVKGTAKRLGIEITEKAAKEIAEKGRGVARILVKYTERTRDTALVTNKNTIDVASVIETFKVMGIDDQGFSLADLNVLKLLAGIDRPVGLKSIAVSINEPLETVENAIEPFLIQKGMIVRTERGRIITDKGADYLREKKIAPKDNFETLFIPVKENQAE
jgi:Holliday junction DNA helicase RuvB